MTMRMQSVQLTESSLSGKSDEESGCLHRMMCAMGVVKSGISAVSLDEPFLFPRLSMGRGIEEFKLILESMTADIAQSEIYKAENFPNIFQTLGRYNGIFQLSLENHLLIQKMPFIEDKISSIICKII